MMKDKEPYSAPLNRKAVPIWLPGFGVLLTILVAFAVQSWYGYQKELQHSTDQAKILANNSAWSVSRRINELIQRATAFANTEGKLIEAILQDPTRNTIEHQALKEKLLSYHPNHLTFALANSRGEILFEDQNEFSSSCRQSIIEFASQPIAPSISVHHDSQGTHFDLVTHWSAPTPESGIFLISFSLESITKHLHTPHSKDQQILLLDIEKKIIIDSQIGIDNAGHTHVLPVEDDARQPQILAQTPIIDTQWIIRVISTNNLNPIPDKELRALILILVLISIALLLWYYSWQHRDLLKIQKMA
ncbi:MAG: hypothetical protein GY696_30405, partial [Gammaproteobacteria bacterium]|nr:hypothetical protein [Gammaproteobacteria bacterium]